MMVLDSKPLQVEGDDADIELFVEARVDPRSSVHRRPSRLDKAEHTRYSLRSLRRNEPSSMVIPCDPARPAPLRNSSSMCKGKRLSARRGSSLAIDRNRDDLR